MALMSVTLTPLERVRRAIIELQAEQPFFAHLSMAMNLQPIAEDDSKAEFLATAGVNARGDLFFNEKFIAGVPRDRMKGLLAHETLHLAFDHLGRLGARNRDIANIAMDMVVNMMVEKSNMKVPEGSIPVDTNADTAWIDTPKGKITIEHVSERWWEDIYGELVKKLDEKGMVQWVKSDSEGGGIDKKYKGRDSHDHDSKGPKGEELSPDEKESHAAKWRQRLAEAATIAKQQGKTPGGMDRFIDGLLGPKVNWREMLRMYLKPHLYPTDYSYAKPHRKSALLGVYLPNVVRESKEVEVLIDTSGSIGQEDLEAFMGEMIGIAKSSAHVTMHVSFGDTRLQGERTTMEHATVKSILALKAAGGGGTSMESCMEELVAKHRPTAKVLCLLTDGCDSFKNTRKSYPFEVIWCISSTGVDIRNWQGGPQYGRRVKM